MADVQTGGGAPQTTPTGGASQAAQAAPAGADPQATPAGADPQIVGLACNHCGYASADSAGGLRRSYPAAVHVIRLPCTGRLEVIHLLKAVEAGADGVMVVGCLEGDCSFMTGNLWARQVVDHVKRLLDELGIQSERVEMYNIPGPNGAGFAAAATEFTERIKRLGPNPLKSAGADPEHAAREALGDVALPPGEGAG